LGNNHQRRGRKKKRGREDVDTDIVGGLRRKEKEKRRVRKDIT